MCSHGVVCSGWLEKLSKALAGFPCCHPSCLHSPRVPPLVCMLGSAPSRNPALQALGAPVTAAAPDPARLEAAAARAAELGREVAGATAALEQLSAVEEQVQVRGPQHWDVQHARGELCSSKMQLSASAGRKFSTCCFAQAMTQ